MWATGSYMLLVYLLAQLRKDNSIVDVAWGLGFVALTVSLAQTLNIQSNLFSLVQILIGLWGVRLFIHILLRNAGREEDWRYAIWRKAWGKNQWWRSLLQVYVVHGLLLILIAAPALAAATAEDSKIGAMAVIGALVWGVGFYFEAVGDFQLSQFLKIRAENAKKKSKKKRTSKFMMDGLWRYTRHPNYFGEITQWWGLWIIVAPTTHGLLAIISPITITILLLKVSGISLLEKKWEKDRAFRKYKQRTSALIPRKPRKA